MGARDRAETMSEGVCKKVDEGCADSAESLSTNFASKQQACRRGRAPRDLTDVARRIAHSTILNAPGGRRRGELKAAPPAAPR